MGELERDIGAWGYVEGGMGGVPKAIANAACSYGVEIFTEKVMWLDIINIFFSISIFMFCFH